MLHVQGTLPDQKQIWAMSHRTVHFWESETFRVRKTCVSEWPYWTEICLLASWMCSSLKDKTARIRKLFSWSLVLLFTQNILKEEKELFWVSYSTFLTQCKAGKVLLAFNPQTCFLMYLLPSIALTKYHKVGGSKGHKCVGFWFWQLEVQNQDFGKVPSET